MISIRHSLAAITTTAVMTAAAWAGPVGFNVTNTSFTPGSGYGSGPVGQLDVTFAANGANNVFSLSLPGDSTTFAFGSVTLNEPTLIGGGETDNLGVSATFTFIDPLNVLQTVVATGTAFTGLINPPLDQDPTDFTIVWDSVLVAFGVGSSFEISMNSLSFDHSGQALTQNATITLISVPEPGSLALVGIALAGLGFAGRRRAG